MPPEINFYNPRSVILFIAILQGVVFAGLLLVRRVRKKKPSDFWLGLLLLVMCSSLITHFIGFANVYDNNQWLTFFPFEITFAHAPLIYLYVKTLTNEKRRLEFKDLLLFLPALVYWIFFFILFLQNLEFKDWYGNTRAALAIGIFIDAALLTWNASLIYFSITHYQRYRFWLDENFSDTQLIRFNWLRNFLYIFAFLFILESAFDVIGIVYSVSYIQAYYLKLVVALVTYYLAIAGYLRSETIEVDFSPRESEEPAEKMQEPDKNLNRAEELQEARKGLEKLMREEKPYLDSQLTLKDLARRTGMNTSTLSRTINRGFNKNFNDFINEYRIEEVKKILRSGKALDETFLSVAFDSGFNSKATFNRAFKKFTGMAPKQFLERRPETGDR